MSAPKGNLHTATIRDFTGGWNIADNPYNLSSKFLPLSDNILVGADGAFSPRFGSKLFAKLRQGVVTNYNAQSITLTTTSGSPAIVVNWANHPFSTGNHITFNTTLIYGGHTITGMYGVIKIDANSFKIFSRQNSASSATSGTLTANIVKDTHLLAGNVIDMAFFQSFVIVFDDIGEIAQIDPTTQTITRIWDVSLSAALSGAPTGWRKQASGAPLQQVSFDVFRQGLLVVNGRNNDKPIEINFQRTAGQPIVQFLLDPGATGGPTNGFIPSADFIQSFNGYVLLYGSNNTTTTSTNTPTTVDISAKNTNCVFVGATNAGDAVQIDLGRITRTVEPRITGVGNLRNRIIVTFYDSAMLGTIGTYTGTVHTPDFSDQIPQHGALNKRTIVNMGNDLIMTDYAGVPTFSQSYAYQIITPERISQLIDPELNRHFGRLSQTTLTYGAFSVYNVRDRQYMLFVPKFDSSSNFNGAATPFYITADLYQQSLILVNAQNHKVSAGDYVVVSGATDIMNGASVALSAANLNGQRKVVAVVDSDYFLMQVGAVPSFAGVGGGGASVSFAPVNDETIGYIFSYNPQLKIRRWTRFRGLYFVAGCLSRDGRVYLANQNGEIYEWGTIDKPYYADWIGSDAYPTGAPINFVGETPWSDFGERLAVKANQNLRVDAQGSGRFTISVFVDNIYQDAATLSYQPSASSDFISPSARTDLVASGAGGFGAGTQTYGGGRRTREQLAFHFPFRCEIAKLRIEGSTTTPLKISGIHMSYLKGSSLR